MKIGFKTILFTLTALFLVESLLLFLFFGNRSGGLRDPVEINEVYRSVLTDWDAIEAHLNTTSLDYTVLDREGNVLYKTKEGLSESIRDAAIYGDTILDLEADGEVVGRLILSGGLSRELAEREERLFAVILCSLLIQLAGCAAYLICLYRAMVKPFHKLERFAERVAGGDLDLPLAMDRRNIFGAFTEAFDLMRVELKKARIAEAKANASKKELVAKLSHDIRTPVASIKVVAEVGAALAENEGNEKSRQSYVHIVRQADRITTLVANLFSATLEELQRLAVEPTDFESTMLPEMLKDADYLGYAAIPAVPECMLYADKLRLQQVFDNLFANSYKYANTRIDVTVGIERDRLFIGVEDHGGGVPEGELSLLKQKFTRGSNTEGVDGAGLGLYISDRFMSEMGGALTVANGKNGLLVTIWIALSGEA
ncbi:MAG: HAMP domain-containing histidine kinase [Bacteroides sp.]|nr:HAMP domain-containing histidine kinase [Eubacterium sp.]MCM1419203.1 HAMP domain-containing histidine kinase [Roseburia sp.]MCM1463030.1 HAMP domain-containing histidine kinase [Bacteroides sp.]